VWNPNVKTIDTVEHNHLILQLPERPAAFIELTICRDVSVMERTNVRRGLGQEAQATPLRPSYRGRDERHDSGADGGFTGKVEAGV
jgi:hypothetical protein